MHIFEGDALVRDNSRQARMHNYIISIDATKMVPSCTLERGLKYSPPTMHGPFHTVNVYSIYMQGRYQETYHHKLWVLVSTPGTVYSFHKEGCRLPLCIDTLWILEQILIIAFTSLYSQSCLRPYTPPVFDRLQYAKRRENPPFWHTAPSIFAYCTLCFCILEAIKTGGVEGLGTRLDHRLTVGLN